MASDPNRDLLPVKEDYCKTNKGLSNKLDHQILSKLSRCELEDRFLRLLDEQMHIKKLANSQEEKIKRLGTKLLRLINERKNGKKLPEQNKEAEDLNLRIIELEHENYALKDKNIVLKQQLSSHSRHFSIQRSPNRSNHTSPLMTMRQSAPPTHREIAYDTTNKSTAVEMQLQEAEGHIKELNEEIKSLHEKIDFLQQNLEKSSLDSRKVKVTENIELIRLQRSLKQQAIQIGALQAQVKNSENSQKMLKDELVKAHKENDEALQVISTKQNEILQLCSKLEEKNVNRLEEDELKERINDLLAERDSLKERSDFLMKSLSAKTGETEKMKELEKSLNEEKCKREKLEEALELLKKISSKSSNEENPERVGSEKIKTIDRSQQTGLPQKKETNFTGDFSEESECSCNKCNLFLSMCKCSQESFLNPEIESDTEPSEAVNGKTEVRRSSSEGKCVAEKMKLERELQYMREMLRSQTARCEAQQVEITRLMYELKLNEEKCKETLQKLDWHLRIFQNYEMSEFEAVMRMRQKQGTQPIANSLPLKESQIQSVPKVAPDSPQLVNVKRDSIQKDAELEQIQENSPNLSSPVKSEMRVLSPRLAVQSGSGIRRKQSSSSNEPLSSKESVVSKGISRIQVSSKPSVLNKNFSNSKMQIDPKKVESNSEKDLPRTDKPEKERLERFKTESRFVDQTFLESSDDEIERKVASQKSFVRKSETYDDIPKTSKTENLHSDYRTHKDVVNDSRERLYSSSENSKLGTDYSTPSKRNEKESKKGRKLERKSEDLLSVTIKIFWFKRNTSSSVWKNGEIEMIYVDFSFLDLNGAETETPESLPTPKHSDELCSFNFTKSIVLTESQKEMLRLLFKTLDAKLISFQVVSDSENFDGTQQECVDLGMAVVTVKDFFDYCNKHVFLAEVKNTEDSKEVIGTLAIGLEATPELLKM